MSIPAKPVSLSVKPYRVSHLCFEVDGVLEVSTANAELGASAPAFDFTAFYAILGGVPTVPGDPSLLLYNALQIEAAVATYALVALRKEARKAALAKAIYARQNAYFAKYANAPAIISQIKTYYSPSLTGSKSQRLDVLNGIADNQWNALESAYTKFKRKGVVKSTESELTSTTKIHETSKEKGTDQTTGQSDEDITEAIGFHQSGSVYNQNPPPKGEHFPRAILDADSYNQEFDEGSSSETSTTKATTTITGKNTENQKIVNTDYAYRTPYFEGQAQYERAKISLIDQQFAQFMYAQNLPNLAQVFKNELNSIDADVFRLQISFLNTILMSPIGGTVTGVYKHPGDAVRAGEPVLRVEDNSTIFLVITVIYPGPIAIGSTVTVQTSLFDSPSLPTSVTGSVVSARGHRDDEKWDLIVKCNNLDSSSKPIFPLGYHFDYDITQITIT